MKYLDRLLQQWRINKALPYIEYGKRILDIGCGSDAPLLQQVARGIGIDPTVNNTNNTIRGYFPHDLPQKCGCFDVIVMLAALEHIPSTQLTHIEYTCTRLLNPNGLLVITVPSPKVDYILKVLQWLRLVDGMQLHEHHKYDPKITTTVFSTFTLIHHSRFQLGLNHLFVFQKQ